MARGHDGAGTTLVLATSTWDTAIRIKKISTIKRSRPVYDDTPLSATDDVEKVAGLLTEHDALRIEYYRDHDLTVPFGAPETGTITFPAKVAQTNGATLVGTGFFAEDETGDIDRGQRGVGVAVWHFDGKTGPTYTAGS